MDVILDTMMSETSGLVLRGRVVLLAYELAFKRRHAAKAHRQEI